MDTEARVFVVDDDEAVRDSLSALIESAGLKAQPFASAEEFLEYFDPSLKGCLLVDVRMPGMNGLELQRELVARNSSLPVIIMTGHGDVPMAVAAMKEGAVDFIEKPHRDKHLLDGIERALDIVRRQSEQEADSQDATDRIARLTPRERDVFDRLIAGKSNKAIARDLGISPRTVEIHRARVMEKLSCQSLVHLVRLGLSAGIDPKAE